MPAGVKRRKGKVVKKTLKIVALLCLTTLTILLMASCNEQSDTHQKKTPAIGTTVPSSHTPAETTPEVTTPEVTTPEVTTSEPTVPTEPGFVDSINGKTVLEALEEFMAAESFDYSWFVIGTEVETGVEVVNTQTIRFNNDEFAMYIQVDDETIVYIGYVDGICYQNYGDEQKTKFSADSIEEVFEQVFGGIDLRKNAGNQFTQEGLDMLSKADIYFDGNVYTVTVEAEMEGDVVKSILTFNTEGKVVKQETYVNLILRQEFTYHSYGEPIGILPPEDADEYEEW